MPPEDRDAEIRDRAYQLWEQAGRPFGREHEFWATAVREIEGDAPAASDMSERSVAR